MKFHRVEDLVELLVNGNECLRAQASLRVTSTAVNAAEELLHAAGLRAGEQHCGLASTQSQR